MLGSVACRIVCRHISKQARRQHTKSLWTRLPLTSQAARTEQARPGQVRPRLWIKIIGKASENHWEIIGKLLRHLQAFFKHFSVNWLQIYGQKLRRIILVHFEFKVVRFDYGRSQKRSLLGFRVFRTCPRAPTPIILSFETPGYLQESKKNPKSFWNILFL